MSIPNEPAMITAENIQAESYYNLCRLQTLTHFANPIRALKATGAQYNVTRDRSGNILTAEEIPRGWGVVTV